MVNIKIINYPLTQVKMEKNENAIAPCTLLTPYPSNGGVDLFHAFVR